MIRARDHLNVISQILVKLISLPYGLTVIALAQRRLPAHESYLMLAAANFMSLPGLLQLGMGYMIVSDVTNAWARDGDLDNLPAVRAGFWVIVATSTLALVASLILTAVGWLPREVLPIIAISCLGQWAIVADYVRLATGGAVKSNLLILAAAVVCAVIVWISLSLRSPSGAGVILGGLAMPFLASLVSFLLLSRNPMFRQLLSLRGPFAFGAMTVRALPMLMNNLAFSLMLVIPLSTSVVPWFPKIGIDELACLRLVTSAIYLYYFALQPIAPIFLRAWYGRSDVAFARMSAAMLGGFAVLCAGAGLGFGLLSPWFINIWLKGMRINHELGVEWAIILGLSLTMMTAVYFFQFTSRPILGAACLIVADLVAVLAPLAGFGVESSMIFGVAAGCALGVVALAVTILVRLRQIRVEALSEAVVAA